MTLSEVAVKRPVFITMVTVALMVLGITAYVRLSTDLFPDVSFPYVSVVTAYPGASPNDVESQVSKKIEDALVSISGLEALQSRSHEGYSLIFAQFTLSTDLNRVSNEVREKVAAVRAQLPSGVKEPVVSRIDIGALPIMTLAASAPMSIAEVRAVAHDRIKSALEQIEGVAEVRIKGGVEREIGVLLDQTALQALRLSPLTVLDQIKGANLTVPAGQLKQAGTEMSVRTLGQFRSIDDLGGLVLATDPRGGQVRLTDVAAVVDGVKDVKTMVRTNGAPSVGLEVVKQTGSNTVAVAKAVKARLDQLQPELPQGYTVTRLLDHSLMIEANAHEVSMALWFGGLMAILIILLFMMDVRSTLISAVALPTSVVGTFFFMYVMGFSLNMMTLLGLSLAIGLLIDDAVVVRENIFKHLEAGNDPHSAAIKGTQEVQLAVLATTLTIVAVFVPVAFMDGIVGQFFKQFGLTVSAATLLSLWVAFTLDPMLSSRFSKVAKPGESLHAARWAAPLRAFFAAVDRTYASALTWAMSHRALTLIAAVAVFLASTQLTAIMGADFMSPEDRGQAVVSLEFPPEFSLEETARRTEALEQQAMRLPHVTALYSVIGPDQESNKASWRVVYAPKEERPIGLEGLKAQLRALLAAAPEAKTNVLSPPAIEGLGEWSPIMIHVTGPNLDTLAALSERLLFDLAGVPGVAEINSSLRPPKPDLNVRLDREAMAHRGLPAAVVGMAVRVAVNGEEAGSLRLEQGETAPGAPNAKLSDEIPIRVRLREDDRLDPERIRDLTLPGFDLVKLDDVADLALGTAPNVIERYNRERKFTLSITPQGRALADVVKDVQATIAAADIPADYRTILDGDAKSQAESAASLAVALLLAVLFIYIVLAGQFESFLHPFTIMLSLPLAMVGAWLGLFLAGETLSISSNIGVILLMGLVTKNAILLVDAALQEQRRGASPDDAMQSAGKKRLRPILMTSAAMVLGMLPTAFGSGPGSEFRSPMAIAVIGGVITSTLLTLVVVPIVYVGFEKWVGKLRRVFARSPAAQEPIA